jgi:hypothetical protein
MDFGRPRHWRPHSNRGTSVLECGVRRSLTPGSDHGGRQHTVSGGGPLTGATLGKGTATFPSAFTAREYRALRLESAIDLVFEISDPWDARNTTRAAPAPEVTQA